MTAIQDDELTRRVIECATEVHRQTGPGLSEEFYGNCLALELTAAGIAFERGRVLPLIYDGQQLDFRLETDFIVADSLLLQIEAVDEIELIHEQELRTGIWMGQFASGLLLNFNVIDMADGIAQMAANPAAGAPPAYDVFDDPDLGADF